MESVRTDSLSDIAYSYILERIISFEYKPNDPIVENDICEILNISRTPLREALRRLEAEGFVTKARNRGTFVRAYTQQDIVESCDIRAVFEVYSLRNCIRSVDPAEVMSVRNQLLALTPESSAEDYYRSDSALHDMITRYCMNTRMRAILKSLAVQLDAVQKISSRTPNRLKSSREEHLLIAEAILAGNLEKATIYLQTHLENVKESCVQTFLRMRMEKLER